MNQPRTAHVTRPLWRGEPGRSGQPNEVDLRRIARALMQRARYLYVEPQVIPSGSGYLIQSPCCSRKVDAEGGIIDIARIEFDVPLAMWALYRKNHAQGRWGLHLLAPMLGEILDCLCLDTGQLFWP